MFIPAQQQLLLNRYYVLIASSEYIRKIHTTEACAETVLHMQRQASNEEA
jgi:hypothetical protein